MLERNEPRTHHLKPKTTSSSIAPLVAPIMDIDKKSSPEPFASPLEVPLGNMDVAARQVVVTAIAIDGVAGGG